MLDALWQASPRLRQKTDQLLFALFVTPKSKIYRPCALIRSLKLEIRSLSNLNLEFGIWNFPLG